MCGYAGRYLHAAASPSLANMARNLKQHANGSIGDVRSTVLAAADWACVYVVRLCVHLSVCEQKHACNG